jgi:hypothetical protein
VLRDNHGPLAFTDVSQRFGGMALEVADGFDRFTHFHRVGRLFNSE